MNASMTPIGTPADRQAVGRAYRAKLTAARRDEPRLSGVVAETLANPGSLTRALLAYKTMKACGAAEDRALDAATAVEYFHTASLLLDDLPAMDDAALRRGRPTAHKRFGEAAAILGSLAFINRAYALIWQALAHTPEEPRAAAAALLEACLGVDGVLQGQSMDVHFGERPAGEAAILEIAMLKTVSLFRLSLALPALLAGGRPSEITLLEELSHWWGLAYQLIDDLKDTLGDPMAGKTTGRDLALQHPNLATCLGPEAARARLKGLLARAAGCQADLVRLRPDWLFLTHMHQRLERESLRLSRQPQAA